MSTQIPDRVAGIVRATEVLSPTSFRFAGRLFQPTAPPAGQGTDEGAALRSLLQATLYQHCYTRPFDGAIRETPYAPLPDDDLLPLLTAAHPGRERWDAGWQVTQVLPSGQVLAQRGAAMRFFWPGEFVNRDGPGMPPRPGSRVSVFVPRDSATLQPGFYFVFGETLGDPTDDGSMLRLYWNVRDAGAPALVRALAAGLNRYQVPFRFKCLSLRSAYPRTDSAVLYVARRYFRLVAELALEVHGAVLPELGSDTPLFALPLAPGLALAEDPANGDSFGMNRCGILAEGIWSAFRQGRRNPADRLREVEETFRRYGVDLERPHLNAGSPHRYETAHVR